MTYISQVINLLVQFLSNVTGSDGLAIIAFTALLKLVLYPITVRQTRSMEEMKLLQPKVQELQEKYGSQSEEYQRRVLELYRATTSILSVVVCLL